MLLVTLDTTRADALGAYGSDKGVTPHLDRLATEGVVFDQAMTVAPITLPSHASVFTGLYPPRHSVRDNGLWPLPESARTLAEIASEAGYQTGAVIGAAVLDELFGLGQGFQTYIGAGIEEESVIYSARSAGAVVDDALEWLHDRDTDRPFFLWLHLYDPHAPYDPPSRFRGDFEASDLYYGEIAYVDDQLGRLLGELDSKGLRDETLVAIASDHGEAFGEHGEYTHGPYCYDSTLRIPLLLRYPDGFGAGSREEGLVSLVDLFPTLVDAMGAQVPSDIDGESLYRRAPSVDRGLYFESYMGFLSFGWSPLAGWIDAGGKYLHSSDPQYFEAADREEETNLAEGASPDALAPYLTGIAAVADRSALQPDMAEMADEDLLAELRALGYASAGNTVDEVPHPLAPTDRPSPAKMAIEYTFLLRAIGLLQSNQREEAIRIFTRTVETSPRNYYALEVLCSTLVDMNRMREALPHLERLTREASPKSVNFQNYAACLSSLGRPDEAIEALNRAIALDPNNRAALEGLVRILQREGRGLEAAPLRDRLERGGAGN